MSEEHSHQIPLRRWFEAATSLFNAPAYQIGQSYEFNKHQGPWPPEPEFNSFLQRHGIWQNLFEISKSSFLNFQLCSQLGIAAGPLLDSSWIKRYASLGYGILSYKTVRTKKYPSHKWPNMIRVIAPQQFTPDLVPTTLMTRPNDGSDSAAITITNSFGMPSTEPYGMNGWMEDVRRAKSYLKSGQLLVVSVVGTPDESTSLDGLADDFALCASLAAEAGADVVEANFSCPNLDSEEGSLYDNPEAAFMVARKIRQSLTHTPLSLKLGYFSDLQLLREVVRRVAPLVDAMVAINSVKFRVQQPSGQPALDPKRQESGVCGYAIRELGLYNVRELCRLREEEKLAYKVVGCGGIFTIADAEQYLSTGADAIEIATAALWSPLLGLKWLASKTAGAELIP